MMYYLVTSNQYTHKEKEQNMAFINIFFLSQLPSIGSKSSHHSSISFREILITSYIEEGTNKMSSIFGQLLEINKF